MLTCVTRARFTHTLFSPTVAGVSSTQLLLGIMDLHRLLKCYSSKLAYPILQYRSPKAPARRHPSSAPWLPGRRRKIQDIRRAPRHGLKVAPQHITHAAELRGCHWWSRRRRRGTHREFMV